MAGSFTDFWENAILNYTYRGVAMPTLTNLYGALFTVAPTDSGGGTEVSGGSYARVSVARTTGTFDAPSNVSGSQKTANTGALAFATASADWGACVAMGFYDASSGGNLIEWSDLTTGRTILNGDTATIAAGSHTITVS